MSASNILSRPLLVLIPILVLVACNGGDNDAEEIVTADSAANIIEGTDPGRTPDELMALLPETVEGLPRVAFAADSTEAVGVDVTATRAHYDGEDDREIDVAIIDSRTVPEGTAWATANVNQTTATGFERTVEIDGRRALEKESRDAGMLTTELNVLVGSYLVRLSGLGVELETLREVVSGLDLSQLSR